MTNKDVLKLILRENKRWAKGMPKIKMPKGMTYEINKHPNLLIWRGYVSVMLLKDLKEMIGMLDEACDDLIVHGGVTYKNWDNDTFTVGFDCAHYGDWVYYPGDAESNEVSIEETYKDIKFVVKEIKSLAKQLDAIINKK